MSDRPLSDHPFCQQDQEPDQIDMMSAAELGTELRKALARIAELEAEIKNIWEHCSVDSGRRQYMIPEDVIRRARKVLEGDT